MWTSGRFVNFGASCDAAVSYENRDTTPEKPRVTYSPSCVHVMPVAHGTDRRSTWRASSPTAITSIAPPSCESTASQRPSGDKVSDDAKPSTGIVKPIGVTERPSGRSEYAAAVAAAAATDAAATNAARAKRAYMRVQLS